jgi:hypothetical protein
MSKKKPEIFQRIGVMIGSPSDATDERQALTDTILRWNAANKDLGLWIEPIRWETHSTPGLEGRPQGMINEELIPQSNCLIAVFRTRAGSPTGKELSGTIEEIREFMSAGKYVVVYFYEGVVSLKALDPDQLKLINQFKKEIQQSGLTESYSTIDELRAKLSAQLYAIVKKATLENTTAPKASSSRGTSLSQQPLTPSSRKERGKQQRTTKPSSVTALSVDSSDRWTLLGDGFLESKFTRQNSDGMITVQIPSQSAEVDALMAGLRPHHFGKSKPMPFAYGNDGWIVTVREVSSESEDSGQLWTIVLIPELIEYGRFATEMALNTGGKHYSADDLARLRAGRILLNVPSCVDETERRSSDPAMVERAVLESHIRGIGTPVTVKDCIIRTVYTERRGMGPDFLRVARLGAIFMLKAGGVVEHVKKLALGPIQRGKVHVEFVGVRPKKYTNVEPTVIQLEGDCPLESE